MSAAAGEGQEMEEDNSSGVRVAKQKGKKGKRVRDAEKVGIKSKAWINAKKDRQRRQGKDVRNDSRFSGRKRNNFS